MVGSCDRMWARIVMKPKAQSKYDVTEQQDRRRATASTSVGPARPMRKSARSGCGATSRCTKTQEGQEQAAGRQR